MKKGFKNNLKIKMIVNILLFNIESKRKKIRKNTSQKKLISDA